MPHTVRPTGRAINPTANITNVTNVGAVTHGRNASSTRINDTGRLPNRSIGGTLLNEGVIAPPMLPQPPTKIVQTRRAEHTFPELAKAE
jgi:hypothetical protein